MKGRVLSTTNLFAAGLILVVGMQQSRAVEIKSTFDADLESWTVLGGNASFIAAGGNPGGGIRATDNAGAPFMQLNAPAAFLGDLSAYNGGSLSFDVREESGSGTLWNPGNFDFDGDFGVITITGNGDTVTLDPDGLGTFSNPVFTTISGDLSAANFGRTELQWSGILADVTAMTIRLENRSGTGEVLDTDNITLSQVPEPGEYALIAGGLLIAFAAYRRRQSRDSAVETISAA